MDGGVVCVIEVPARDPRRGEGLRPPLEQLISLEPRHLRGAVHHPRRLQLDVPPQPESRHIPRIHAR